MESSVKLSKQSGFSLMELVTVITISGVLVTVATGIVKVHTETFVEIFNRSALMSQGRSTLRLLQNDLSQMCPDSISVMQAAELTFTDVEGNSISYRYLGSNLERNHTVLVSHLQAAPFSYFDDQLNSVGSTDSLGLVKTELQLANNQETVTLEDLFYARN